MLKSLNLTFNNGTKSSLIQIDNSENLSTALQYIGLTELRPTLVVIGGAGKMSNESLIYLHQLFIEVLAPLAEELGAYVIDGGTDAGVIQMMGQARSETNATFPLIGIAPSGKITLPDTSSLTSHGKLLEPNHTHFILVPGFEWGDESPWIADVATTLAGDFPSVAILINGGETTLVDLFENVEVGRPILVLAGSGRLADEIATAMRVQHNETRERVSELVRTGHLTLFDLSEPLSALIEVLRQKLTVKKNVITVENKLKDQPNIPLLKSAWKRQQIYSKNASAAQKHFIGLRLWILSLSVASAVLAIAHAELGKILGETHKAVLIINFCLLLVPIITSVLLAGALKFDKGNNWILLRGNAEAIKREIYLYRTRVGNYRENRNAELARRIKIISERLRGSSVHQTCFNPYEAEVMFQESELILNGKSEKDDKFSDLNPETYISWRLEDQFNHYRRKAKQLNKQLQLYQWGAYLLGGVGTFLAATSFQIWVAITSALVGALSSFLEFKRVEATLIGYNQAADNLYDIQVLWNSLSVEEQEKFNNFELLVQTTEATIQTENDSWLQDMQDKLAELYGQTDKTRLENSKDKSHH